MYIYISDIMDGDYLLCVGQATYHLDQHCRCRRLPPDGWHPLAVVGGLFSLTCTLDKSRRVTNM